MFDMVTVAPRPAHGTFDTVAALKPCYKRRPCKKENGGSDDGSWGT